MASSSWSAVKFSYANNALRASNEQIEDVPSHAVDVRFRGRKRATQSNVSVLIIMRRTLARGRNTGSHVAVGRIAEAPLPRDRESPPMASEATEEADASAGRGNCIKSRKVGRASRLGREL